MSARRAGEVGRLFRERPRSPFLGWSLLVLAVIAAGSWLFGGFDLAELGSPRRLANLRRFAGELVPYPLAGGGFDLAVGWDWVRAMTVAKGWQAAMTTLAISVAAIVLAGIVGALASLPAARNFADPEPFLPAGRAPRLATRLAWRSVLGLTRGVLIFARAIPEYVWAFLFVVLLGPSAWPAVLALALHNSGILGKLGAEMVENAEPSALAALRGLGAGRGQIAVTGLGPMLLNRFLLFFFYRWETCVREATVLGLLGIVSLGYWIQDARARNHYDELLYFVLVGSALVVAGDLLSAAARELVRRRS